MLGTILLFARIKRVYGFCLKNTVLLAKVLRPQLTYAQTRYTFSYADNRAVLKSTALLFTTELTKSELGCLKIKFNYFYNKVLILFSQLDLKE